MYTNSTELRENIQARIRVFGASIKQRVGFVILNSIEYSGSLEMITCSGFTQLPF